MRGVPGVKKAQLLAVWEGLYNSVQIKFSPTTLKIVEVGRIRFKTLCINEDLAAELNRG